MGRWKDGLNRYDVLDTNSRIIRNLRNIGHTLRWISEGKGSQQRVLIVLLEMGPVSQSELTLELGIQPGSASEVLKKLENAGLIARTPNPADHRTAVVQLSENGRAAAEEAKRRRTCRHSQMFHCLSEEERKTLLALLEKVNDDWQTQYSHPDGQPPRRYRSEKRCGNT